MDPVELRTPDPETIEVLDFDLIFDGGAALELTLNPDDSLRQDGDVLTVEVAATGDIYDIALPKLLYTRKRTRTIAVAHPEPISAGVPPRAILSHLPAIDSLQVLPELHTDRHG